MLNSQYILSGRIFWVVNTVRYQLKQKEITSSWCEIIRVMNTQKCVTTVAQNNKDEIISIRRCSEPDPKAQQIYDSLKYKPAPFVRKKSVVLKPESEKNQLTQNKVVIRI